LPVSKRYIGPSGGGSGADSVHDCQRHAFLINVSLSPAAMTRVVYFLVTTWVAGRVR